MFAFFRSWIIKTGAEVKEESEETDNSDDTDDTDDTEEFRPTQCTRKRNKIIIEDSDEETPRKSKRQVKRKKNPLIIEVAEEASGDSCDDDDGNERPEIFSQMKLPDEEFFASSELTKWNSFLFIWIEFPLKSLFVYVF